MTQPLSTSSQARAAAPSDKPTSAVPIEIEGVVFRCYRTGKLRYAWKSDDGRARVHHNGGRSSFSASVDRVNIGARFRSDRAAMHAAVKVMSAVLCDIRPQP